MSTSAAAPRSETLAGHVSHHFPVGAGDRDVRRAARSAQSGPPAGARATRPRLDFSSKTANLRLDEPPLTVRMHDRSRRLLTFACSPYSPVKNQTSQSPFEVLTRLLTLASIVEEVEAHNRRDLRCHSSVVIRSWSEVGRGLPVVKEARSSRSAGSPSPCQPSRNLC